MARRRDEADGAAREDDAPGEPLREQARVEEVAQPDVRGEVAVEVRQVLVNGALLVHPRHHVARVQEDDLRVPPPLPC